MNKYQQLGLKQTTQEFRGRSNFIVQLWWIVQNTLFAWSPQFLYGWRNFILRLFGAKVGNHVLIRPTARITYPWRISIGNYCRVGDEAVLYSLGEISIGDHTVISQRTYICTGIHNYHVVSFDLYAKPIDIADQVWVAADVFIAPGVHIGTGAVIGVRSTVLNDIPEGMICFGNPAKPIRAREISNQT